MLIVRTLLNTAFFCAALVGVCSGIHAALPFPKVLGVYQKWLYFQKHKDELDAVFMGSSRVYHGVVATQFDARVSELTGRKVRTFNAGYDAMWPPESLFMMRQLLAMKPKRLKYVFIECLDIYADLSPETRDTRRTAYWHDLQHTAMAWGSIRDQQFAGTRGWELAATHAEILLRNWTNQGRGAEWLGYEFGVERRKKESRWEPPAAWKDNGGYEPEDDQPLAGEELKRFLAGVEARKKSLPPAPMKPTLRRAFAEMLAEIKAAGCTPIVLITPTVRADENFEGFPPEVAVWRYHDPKQYPALYEPGNRHDFTHLNHAGAQAFTELLATRFATMLKDLP